MEITRDNYESFLLDHLEGRLSQEQSLALRAFALSNPDLEIDLSADLEYLAPSDEIYPKPEVLYKDLPSDEELLVLNYLEGLLNEDEKADFEKKLKHDINLRSSLNAFKGTKLQAEDHLFADSEELLPDHYNANEQRVLSYQEGLMEAAEKRSFETDLDKSLELQQLYKQYQHSRLQPDLSVVFSGKEQLLKEAKIIALFNYRAIMRFAAAIILLAMMVVLLWPAEKIQVQVTESQNIASLSGIEAIEDKNEPSAPAGPETPQYAPIIHKEKHLLAAVPVKKTSQSATAANKITPQAEEKITQREESPMLAALEFSAGTIKEAESEIEASTQVVNDLEMLAMVEEKNADDAARAGFWQKAVLVASQVKKLGFKGIDGEKEEGAFRISFNTLRVEKKYSGL